MWDRTLKKAPVGAGIPTAYTERRKLAAQRDKWRELCGAALQRGNKHLPAMGPQAAWARLVDGPAPRTVLGQRRLARERLKGREGDWTGPIFCIIERPPRF
jgi:hypothetical protein